MASKTLQLIIVGLLLSASLIIITTGLMEKQAPQESTIKPPVVIRVDDIQDYAFREAQLYIIKLSSEKQIPLSLSVIPKIFSLDSELVDAVADAVHSGSEVTAHGWQHENLTTFTMLEQEQRLIQAKKALKNTLGVDTTILVPPLFDYNDDTLLAMKKAEYDTISSTRSLQNPGITSNGIMSLPSTVNFSDFDKYSWRPKNLQQLLTEVDQSVSMHSYAMVVIHPQELLSGDQMNQTTVKTFEDLLNGLTGKYTFTTIKELSNTMKNNAK